MVRVAINGYGRIGRCVLRALYATGLRDQMQVVEINEPADLATIAHLTKYDSTHGRFPAEVSAEGDQLRINGDLIQVSAETDPQLRRWEGIDLLFECSGRFDKLAELQQMQNNGAARVLLSQPGEAAVKAIVFGSNENAINDSDTVLSAASCTTNCIVPVIETLHRAFGVESGVITTIHSTMNDQPVIDAYHHTDLRKTRSASQSIIPVDTGLAAGIGRIVPELAGRFAAQALRVPTTNVSAMDLNVVLRESVSVKTVNQALAQTAHNMPAILGYTEEPLASCDFNGDPRSGIVDASQTRLAGRQTSVLTWFDNEWAYACRMLDVAAKWLRLSKI